MKDGVPTLVEVDKWFETSVIPKRTTSAGFSINRIIKTPRGLLGNTSDPNGLCGDASLYVYEAFDKAFPKTFRDTSDGYQLGGILWEGAILNHMANVMLPKSVGKLYVYEVKGKAPMPIVPALEGRASYVMKKGTMSGKELAGLHVYDLYYKKRTTVEDWWQELDEMGGRLTVGLEQDFA
jgi:hypothetical protein